MHTQAQNELNRIEESNFFSNGTEVFYVLSNKFNSSGFLSEHTGFDNLEISNLDEGKMFDNKVFIISKKTFSEKYNSHFQYRKKNDSCYRNSKNQFEWI